MTHNPKERILRIILCTALLLGVSACGSPTADHTVWHTGGAAGSKVGVMGPSASIGP